MFKQHSHHSAVQREKGFTLIELMIVVAIIAILGAIAYPNYMDSVSKSRRADGQGALMNFANAMERYATTNGDYDGATAAGVFSTTYPSDGSAVYYNLSVVVTGGGTGYTLTADATGAQEGDGNLQYTNTGVKRWDRDNDGFGGGDNNWKN